MPQGQSGVPADALEEANSQLSAAAAALQEQIGQTGDFNALEQLQAQYDIIMNCMGQVEQAKATADQAVLEQTADMLKAQAASLQGMEAKIQKLIADEAQAARIIGYITRVIALLA